LFPNKIALILVIATNNAHLLFCGKQLSRERKVFPVTDKNTPATPNSPTKGQSETAPVTTPPVVAKAGAEPKLAPAAASATKA
jgi:hypothetical protein